VLSPYNSIDYYEDVRKTLGTDATDGFLRLFMVPGMEQCHGGAGTDDFDALSAVKAWVDKGKAPDSLAAAHLTSGRPDRSRPFCSYPRVAHHQGQGSTDDADSFRCAPLRKSR
jgi:feruloyl esterase